MRTEQETANESTPVVERGLTPHRSMGRAGGLAHWLTERLLRSCGDMPVRIVLWDGSECLPRGGEYRYTLRIHNRATLLRLIYHPDLYFGEAYSSAELEVEGDLLGFLETVYTRHAASGGLMQKLAYALISRRRSTSKRGARRNISHHYDIGNDFYRLWLDREAMQYTCAYYPRDDMTLEQAQRAKLDHVCRKLQLQPGETVVEAGCGWGGLARHMARHYGVHVRAYNISKEQIAFARQKAEEEGLADLVEYVEDDYRNIDGQYDAFVSVGMLEHVGPENYHELGRVIDRCLKADGRGLIHTIGRNYPAPMNAWIEKHIFPGARPPSLQEMTRIFEPWHFAINDVENLRLHYARTLSDWHQRYEENVDKVREMFDEHFVRAWRLYLVGSIAAFTTGQLQLFQVTFNRERSNHLPWSRSHLYRDDLHRPE